MWPLPAGARVIVQNLVAKPEFNGMRARVLSFDADRGRYTIELLHGGNAVSLKAECVEVDATITPHGRRGLRSSNVPSASAAAAPTPPTVDAPTRAPAEPAKPDGRRAKCRGNPSASPCTVRVRKRCASTTDSDSDSDSDSDHEATTTSTRSERAAKFAAAKDAAAAAEAREAAAAAARPPTPLPAEPTVTAPVPKPPPRSRSERISAITTQFERKTRGETCTQRSKKAPRPAPKPAPACELRVLHGSALRIALPLSHEHPPVDAASWLQVAPNKNATVSFRYLR
jgi:hypothetical protein